MLHRAGLRYLGDLSAWVKIWPWVSSSFTAPGRLVHCLGSPVIGKAPQDGALFSILCLFPPPFGPVVVIEPEKLCEKLLWYRIHTFHTHGSVVLFQGLN